MALMDPFAYEMAQLTHDEVMRDALEETGGYEINTQGDSFELAFGSATQAVRFCLMVQEKLLSYKWPYAVRKLPGCETVWGRLGEGISCTMRQNRTAWVAEPKASSNESPWVLIS